MGKRTSAKVEILNKTKPKGRREAKDTVVEVPSEPKKVRKSDQLAAVKDSKWMTVANNKSSGNSKGSAQIPTAKAGQKKETKVSANCPSTPNRWVVISNKERDILPSGKICDSVQAGQSTKTPKISKKDLNELEKHDQLMMDTIQVTVNESDDDFNSEPGDSSDEEEPDEFQLNDNTNRNMDYFQADQQDNPSGIDRQVQPTEQNTTATADGSIDVRRMVQEMVQREVQRGIQQELARSQTNVTPGKSLLVKSPSDTTVYAPALVRAGDGAVSSIVKRKLLQGNGGGLAQPTPQFLSQDIENAIRQIRVNVGPVASPAVTSNMHQSAEGDMEQHAAAEVMAVPVNQAPKLQQEDNDLAQHAKAAANDIIIQAEKFCAAVKPLPGTSFNYVRAEEVDDEFFHITCHVEQSLKDKIEKGEFIDLERLITKPFQQAGGAQRLELVSKDGATYFTPAAERGTKISNVKKWD